ncbi:MAG TPA: NirD/YgiW/YdeI family stress tolerance protein [Burkholderiaceae bacterium]|nr:NirD/YgiW/YdeI family stress tolerance protein [Burkholderiaceae bacterium]
MIALRKQMLAAVIGSVVSLSAHAQYTGPSNSHTITVKEILANPIDDQHVVIEGNLLRQIGKKKYMFSDGTGEIVAEIKEKRFEGQKVDENTKVELVGEVDTGYNRPPEIEVDELKVLK